MRKEMKNRMVLLGSLLVIGLALAGVGSASGVASLFQGKPEVFEAGLSDGNMVLFRDGKLIGNFILPEEEGLLTIEASSEGIHIKILIREEMEKIRPGCTAEFDRWFEIAKKDERVQKLIAGLVAGEDYSVIAGAAVSIQGEVTAILLLEVQGKYYSIAIDVNREKVESVEEQTFGVIIGTLP